MTKHTLDICIQGFAQLDQDRVTDEVPWNALIQRFSSALEAESNSATLESAVVNKLSWYLPIDCKFELLEKAKNTGCNSHEFWADY